MITKYVLIDDDNYHNNENDDKFVNDDKFENDDKFKNDDKFENDDKFAATHLIKVHHEKFVGGSQLSALACELPVKVGHVLSVALNKEWVSKSFSISNISRT